jgi:Mrp family chromosome partitioning ATPase
MATENSSHTARYVTLQDYLRVLRRYRNMIVAVTIIGGIAGYVSAARQNDVYQATAQVTFQDPTQDLNLVGYGSSSVQSPSQLAAVNAQTANGPALMTKVKAQLKTPLSVGALSGAISPQVQVNSGLLEITSRASTAAFAADLANAAANQLQLQDNHQAKAEFKNVATQLSRQIQRLSKPRNAKSPAAVGQLGFDEDELARLTTIGEFAKSAQIAKLAQVPGAPVSPKPTRSTVIGLVIGLLLALIVAFIRDSLDRRLRTPHDIEESLRFPVVGHVRNEAMGLVAQLRNGAGDGNPRDLESFRILRRNVEFLDRERVPRSIVVTSAVPEEGKTTVSSSLAFALAAAGRRTLLIDCDLRRPAIAERLGIEQSPGLSEFLMSEASLEQIQRAVEFQDPPPGAPASTNGSNGVARPANTHGLVCIPSGAPSPNGAELLGSRRFAEFLEEVGEQFDIIVMDSSPLLPVADTREMLSVVDAVLLCAREFQTTREQALAAKAALDRFPSRPTGVVVTGVRPQGAGYESYSYSYGYS